MGQLYSALIFVHLLANLVWVGSLLSAAWVLASGGWTAGRATREPASGPDPGALRARAAISLGLYRRLATPAFGLSFVAGLTRLLLDAEFYFVSTKFMHGKLTFALLAIVLHHVIGARINGVASGKSANAGNVAGLAIGFMISAIGAVFFVTWKGLF